MHLGAQSDLVTLNCYPGDNRGLEEEGEGEAADHHRATEGTGQEQGQGCPAQREAGDRRAPGQGCF